METRVSIIMLVYNHERFLRQALESILLQKVDFEYELIIGEDCSTDHSRSIIREYEKKFQNRAHVIYRDRNIGVTGNFLDCMSRCKGKYIAFLEGDDCWTDPLKLQKMADFLQENLQYSAAAHNYTVADAENKFLRKGLPYDALSVFDKNEFMKYRLPSQTSTLMIRNITADLKKNYLGKIRKYMWLPGDRILAMLLLQYGDIAVLPDVMSIYHFYTESGGTNWSSQHPREDYFYICKVIRGMEKLGRKIQYPLEMEGIKIYFLQEAVSKWTKSRWKLYIRCLSILITERHKIHFLKAMYAAVHKERR